MELKETKLDGKTILVIGGAGFIGSHLVNELLKENIGSLTIYDNFTRGKMEKYFRVVERQSLHHIPIRG
jgi:UDP-glucose 4-epimerase